MSFTPIAEQMGIITPSGLHFERHHAGRADIDPKQHRLIVHGLVDRAMKFSVEDIKRFPSTSVVRFIECPANGGMEWRGAQLERCQYVRGMISCSEWTGVTLRTLLRETGLKATAKWMLAEGADAAAMTRSVPIEKVLDDAMIATARTARRSGEQGYPPPAAARLGGQYEREMAGAAWNSATSPAHARRNVEIYRPDARRAARQFTWFMEANSVVTYPSPERPFEAKGFHVHGFAWSGLGTIKRGCEPTAGGGRMRVEDRFIPRRCALDPALSLERRVSW